MTAAGGRVGITTLGAVRVHLDGREVDALEGRLRNIAVLILLAVEGTIERDRLAAHLWGDREPKKARQSLSEALYELRKALGDEWFEANGTTLSTTAAVDLDVDRFNDAIDEGNDAEAVSIYRGHFLRSLSLSVTGFEEWVASQERHLFGRYRATAERAILASVEAGELRDAVIGARDWVELRPEDDEAQHLLIALLALDGDRAGALRQFESYAALLGDMELTPLDRTMSLVSAVRSGASATVRTLLRLSGNDKEAADRATQLLFTRPAPGPRVVLIRDPREMEGRVVPVPPRGLTIGPEGDLPVAARSAFTDVLATIRNDAEGRAVLQPTEGTTEVFTLVTGDRILRVGRTFRIGQQLFVLEVDEA